MLALLCAACGESATYVYELREPADAATATPDEGDAAYVPLEPADARPNDSAASDADAGVYDAYVYEAGPDPNCGAFCTSYSVGACPLACESAWATCIGTCPDAGACHNACTAALRACGAGCAATCTSCEVEAGCPGNYSCALPALFSADL